MREMISTILATNSHWNYLDSLLYMVTWIDADRQNLGQVLDVQSKYYKDLFACVVATWCVCRLDNCECVSGQFVDGWGETQEILQDQPDNDKSPVRTGFRPVQTGSSRSWSEPVETGHKNNLDSNGPVFKVQSWSREN